MEKRGVVIDNDNDKTASDGCPECGAELEEAYKCPNCGTRPFERRPDAEKKEDRNGD